MSLLNKMLKELEQRSQPLQLPRSFPSPISPTPLFKVNKLFITVIIGMMIMTSGFLFFKTKKINNKLMPLLPFSASITRPLATDIAPAWLDPVAITGIAIQNKSQISELSLSLNHAALYQIDMNEMRNQIIITFDHGQLVAELPTIRNAQTAIVNIESVKFNNDLQLRLSLAPDAVIKYINLINEATLPELVIAIENNTPTNAYLADEQEKPIKSPTFESVFLKQYNKALSEAGHGKILSAISTLTELITVNPYFHDARTALVALLIQNHQIPEAKRVLEKGITLTPHFLPFLELKARLLMQAGDHQKALSLLLSNAPPIEENTHFHGLIADLYTRNHQEELAAKTYRLLLTMDQRNSHWWLGLGTALEKIGEQTEAAEAYTQALRTGHLSSESLAYLQDRLHALREARHVSD